MTEHTYPPDYPKDANHWAIRRAWEILDALTPGAIPENCRFFLAGAIAGALMRVAHIGAALMRAAHDDERNRKNPEGKC
jgi:hypothetical protein